MIRRIIQKTISEQLFKGKAIILIGPRQVGKTTLLQSIKSEIGFDALWLNCDEPDVRSLLDNITSTQLQSLIGNHKLVFIDEAQRAKNIGITLKLLVDNLPSVQVIATGSSAFELANEVNEPLTGRKWEYQLYPISTSEMVTDTSRLEEKRLLTNRLIYGFYPDIINYPERSEQALMGLANNYLYKDLLSLEAIRKPALLEKLLLALALQVGNEVSYSEIGQTIGSEQRTVEHYIQLLEKCFVVFTIPAFSRNIRNEIKKGKKVYFIDNGIRNAIIKNFNPLAMRNDVGALWENFIMSERQKHNAYSKQYVNTFFWRTHAQQEIDLIEEQGGKLRAVEFKWNSKRKASMPENFTKAYPNATFEVVSQDNYLDFLL